MEKTVAYLKKQGFAISEKIELLKGTNSTKNDKRYFWDAVSNSFGLHISNSNFDDTGWDELKEELKSSNVSVKLLNLGINSLQQITILGDDFQELEFLNLSQNEQLKSAELRGLQSLKELITDRCPNLSSIKLEGNFDALLRCNVSFCALQNLVLPTSLPKLNYFHFSNNQLNNGLFLAFISKNQTINNIYGNDNPFENDVLKGIFEDLDNSEINQKISIFLQGNKVQINRNKLILLGNTQAGKTSLCDILRDNDTANGDSTHGVNIFLYDKLEDNKGVKIQYQVYDFGGQDFYHNTHLAFFGENAKYILVWGNGQEDKFGQVKANKFDRNDDIFPMVYWQESIFMNLKEAESSEVTKRQILENFKIKLALLQNIRLGTPPELLDQRALVKKHGVSDFLDFQLRSLVGKKLQPAESEIIKGEIDQWLVKNNRPIEALQENVNWSNFFEENPKYVVVQKKALKKSVSIDLKNKVQELDEADFDILSYAFVIYKPSNTKKSKYLDESVIVNHGKFTQWIYAILNIENLLNKGQFCKEDAEKWLSLEFGDALTHIDFIIDFLLEYKMIFHIEGSTDYLVPQYLPEPQYPADKLLLKLFDEAFLRYEFTGFYHTQLLTDIIAEFFDFIVKEPIGKRYKHLIWKNKVILYLSEQRETTDDEPKDFLLIEFKLDIDEQKPMLLLSELRQNILKKSFGNLKRVIDFIDKKILRYKPIKLIKTPNGTYLDAKLLKQDNHQSNGNQTDLVYDPDHQYFYRKGDFPLFFDPTQYAMKKIFISYSKYDEDYKNDFKEHLVSLQRENLIDTFDDRELELGEKWDSKLRQKIVECDYFVCLVSVKFLNVGYIQEIELPDAFKYNKRLILIIIKPCDWTNFSITWVDDKGNKTTEKLGDYNAFDKGSFIGLNPKFETPKGQTIIREYSQTERDYRWLEVTNKLRELIKKDN